ncbi:MAG: SprT-like domain-containing protein [Candidatus Sedimenticola sp. 6PFRAG7]
MNNPLHKAASNQVDRLLNKARDHYDHPMPLVEIRFDLKGTTAGQARMWPCTSPLIRFNSQLLEANPETFLERTVPHEVAHLVTCTLHGNRIKPHGEEWKAVMSLFGAEASRCHSYDTSQTQQRRLQCFDYRCDCRSHELTSIRHNRVQQGQRYYCKSCRQILVPGRQ